MSQPTRPWWLPWRDVVGGFALAFFTGMACAHTVRAFGDWNQGFRWERELIVWVHRPVPAAVDALFLVTPWFGTNLTLIPAVVLVCWWVWRPLRRPDLAMQLIAVQIGSYLLNPSLKALFERDRPHLFEQRGWFAWSSYPSGHAIASVSVLMTIAVVLHRAKGWKWPYYRPRPDHAGEPVLAHLSRRALAMLLDRRGASPCAYQLPVRAASTCAARPPRLSCAARTASSATSSSARPLCKARSSTTFR